MNRFERGSRVINRHNQRHGTVKLVLEDFVVVQYDGLGQFAPWQNHTHFRPEPLTAHKERK